MNITIFGATGGTGRALVDQALAVGHHVTALVRTPATLAVTHTQLCVLQGDIHDADQVAAAIVGQDAILSALGTNQRGPVSLCTDGIAHILPAMTRYSVRRLIALSAYGAADSHDADLYNRMLWLMQREKMLDKERMEALLRQSDVDWTIIRPPALGNGPRTGRYHLGVDLHMNITSRISRANVADCMLQQLAVATPVRQTLAITN